MKSVLLFNGMGRDMSDLRLNFDTTALSTYEMFVFKGKLGCQLGFKPRREPTELALSCLQTMDKVACYRKTPGSVILINSIKTRVQSRSGGKKSAFNRPMFGQGNLVECPFLKPWR